MRLQRELDGRPAAAVQGQGGPLQGFGVAFDLGQEHVQLLVSSAHFERDGQAVQAR